MRSDFKVLSCSMGETSQIEEIREKYEVGDFDGINLRISKGVMLENLDFLAKFSGLKYIEILGAVRDDTSAFLIRGIEEVVLLTKCRVPIPELIDVNLTGIGIDDRSGKERLAPIDTLRSFSLWNWSGGLEFLGDKPRLYRLMLEGLNRLSSLDGIQQCAALTDIEIKGARTESLRPLRPLVCTRRLWILGSPEVGDTDAVLDLGDLLGMDNLEEFRLTYGGTVQSVAPLAQLAKLRDVRLRGTEIAEGGIDPLVSLDRDITVVGPND